MEDSAELSAIVVDPHPKTRETAEANLFAFSNYEFVEDGGNDPDVVQGVLDFSCHVGFGHTEMMFARNWKSGVLVDFLDIGDWDGDWRTILSK